jgi:hypothetical protein
LSLFILFAILAYADSKMFTNSMVHLFSRDIEAVIFDGTMVNTVKTKDGYSVKLNAWIDEKGVLYADDKHKIPTGYILNGEKAYNRKTEFTGEIKEEYLTSDIRSALSQAENLYYERCGTCHRAFDPSKYSNTKWLAVMESMKFQAGLSDEEYKQIIRYQYILTNLENSD